MRNAVIGLIIGIVAGLVLGATVIAPRLTANLPHRANADAKAAAAPKPTAQPAPTASAAAPRQTPLTLKMVSAYAEALPAHGTLARRLSETVWKLSAADFDLRLYPPGSLVPETETVAAMLSGAVDAYFTSPDTFSSRAPALEFFAGPPLGIPIEGFLAWMQVGEGAELMREALAQAGLAGVLCGLVPAAGGGWFRQPLKGVADLAGKRIHARGLSARVYRRLGAAPVQIPLADVLIGFEAVTLDGAALSAPNVDVAVGVHEMVKNYYVPDLRRPAETFVFVMAAKNWEALSDARRTLIRSGCNDNIAQSIAEGEAAQVAALKTIAGAGVNVRRWPSEISKAFANAWKKEAQEAGKADKLFARVKSSYDASARAQSIWRDLQRR